MFDDLPEAKRFESVNKASYPCPTALCRLQVKTVSFGTGGSRHGVYGQKFGARFTWTGVLAVLSLDKGPMEVSPGALVSPEPLICTVGVRAAQAPPVQAQAVVRRTYNRVGKAPDQGCASTSVLGAPGVPCTIKASEQRKDPGT